MSSFFTLPASQRKRKRDDHGPRQGKTRDGASSRTSQSRKVEQDDESITGSDSETPDAESVDGGGSATLSESSESDDDETHTARRTKLAARYLENTRREILAEGFDAKDIDNELLAQRMGERLKEDTAESKGRIYRWIADDYTFGACRTARFSNGTGVVTDVAVCKLFVYTVSSDARLSKWELGQDTTKPPRLVRSVKGDRKSRNTVGYDMHTKDIYCVAASEDGKYVATGGKDRKLVVWDAETLKPLRAFTQHRDAVMALAFRRGTNQLFSASRDRTVKIWSLNELAYVETLYGHQDEIVDVASLTQEHCVTVGARDRTARYWKVVEENQLIFNGGGARDSLAKKRRDEGGHPLDAPPAKRYFEGSIDRIIMLDEDTFITGSDNGGLSLWNVHKKKPVFTYPLSHGLDDPPALEDISAEMFPNPKSIPKAQPRSVTALAGVPYSNLFFSGSWDGHVRVWKLSEDRRSIESLATLGASQLVPVDDIDPNGGHDDLAKTSGRAQGIINGITVYETGARGKETLHVIAATGKQHRSGRWAQKRGRNATIAYHIPRR